MEEEEYSKESKQAAVKIADKGREEKIEEARELEKERTGINMLPRENQATQHRMDYYTLQTAEPQTPPVGIEKAYR